MIGSIVGGAMKVGGAIAGGIMGAKSARKQARMIAEEKSKNQAWFDRRYNEDSTQRADAQAALTQMRDVMKERSAASAGAAAVMGGTEESIAAEKEAQNRALAETTSGIVVNGEARKDAIEAQFQSRDAQLGQMQLDVERQKAGNISGAISGMSKVGTGFTVSNMRNADCDITIEQLPLYPDGLVFDGIDDLAKCINVIPMKTIIMKTRILSNNDSIFFDQRKNGNTAFLFAGMHQNNSIAYNARNAGGSTYINGVLNTTQTCAELRDKDIVIAMTNDGVTEIVPFTIGGSASTPSAYPTAMVLYDLIGYTGVLAQEQIQSEIKNYNL